MSQFQGILFSKYFVLCIHKSINVKIVELEKLKFTVYSSYSADLFLAWGPPSAQDNWRGRDGGRHRTELITEDELRAVFYGDLSR